MVSVAPCAALRTREAPSEVQIPMQESLKHTQTLAILHNGERGRHRCMLDAVGCAEYWTAHRAYTHAMEQGLGRLPGVHYPTKREM